jgi:hypothetical protein
MVQRSQSRRAQARCRGFALPLVLAVLAVGSILMAALFLLARLEIQSADNGLNAAGAFQAAETGLTETVAWWDAAQYNQLAIGSTLAITARHLVSGGYGSRLTRLSPALFLVESDGWHQARANLPIAHRTLRSLVRLAAEAPPILAALTVMDSITWDGSSVASGMDSIPPGWGGCTLDSSVAGIAAPPSAPTNLGGCSACAAGNPPILLDSAISVTMLSVFGTSGYSALAARALYSPVGTVGTVAPQVAGSPAQCAISDSLNWGEPRQAGPFAACAHHQPVIHSPGDLTLTGGRGQGTLLVDGDLELGGGFEFVGLVIVRGTVRNGPGGGTILGALLAGQIRLSSALPFSPLAIRYSACVLPFMSRGTSSAIPLPYRSWAQSF